MYPPTSEEYKGKLPHQHPAEAAKDSELYAFTIKSECVVLSAEAVPSAIIKQICGIRMTPHHWITITESKYQRNSDDIVTLRSHRYLKRIWNTQRLPCLVDLACSFKRDTLVSEHNGIMNLVSNCIIIFHITFLVAREQSAHISRPC